MKGAFERLRAGERSLALLRVATIPFAIFQVALGGPYPEGYDVWAWLTVGFLAAGALLVLWIARRPLDEAALSRVGIAALTLDTVVLSSFVLVYNFDPGTPVRQLIFLLVLEAGFRYRIAGALAMVAITAPVMVAWQYLRSSRLDAEYQYEEVTFQVGVAAIMALLVGWLVERLTTEATIARSRAQEAEELRDQLGRRVDLLDAANRCARALASSLEPREAFAAFIRELRGLVPFDRATIALLEADAATIMATAGRGEDEVFPAGAVLPPGSLLEHVARSGETVYREDLGDPRWAEEPELAALGLRSRAVAPLVSGTRSIGVLAVVRIEPAAFKPDEIELITLLGRLVGTAVQNIRAYEAERTTVEELRRLSALRADFVSLVSHELRSPMAAVIGAARTLQDRWRELTPEQRAAFLALIADETNRLAALIGDVLDTSRIEAGTFSFAFHDVDLAELVRETVAAVQIGQDEVTIRARAPDTLPRVRADRERIKQVLLNLVDNAVKYSPPGDEVEVRAWAENAHVHVTVRDSGPGIPLDQQKLIFEKFGRADVGGAGKPGTGLGLFIARSIVEAHGGSLEVASAPGRGAVFAIALPTPGA